MPSQDVPEIEEASTQVGEGELYKRGDVSAACFRCLLPQLASPPGMEGHSYFQPLESCLSHAGGPLCRFLFGVLNRYMSPDMCNARWCTLFHPPVLRKSLCWADRVVCQRSRRGTSIFPALFPIWYFGDIGECQPTFRGLSILGKSKARDTSEIV